MKKLIYFFTTLSILLIFFISYIYISRYYDKIIINDNNYFNCDYWNNQPPIKEVNIQKINFLILTVKKCKIKTQNEFLLNHLNDNRLINKDFLSGKPSYIDQRAIEALNEIYESNKSKNEWKIYLDNRKENW